MVRGSGTYLLSGVIALTCGCAKPLPAPHSRISEPQGFVHRFPSAPRVVVEDHPTQPFRQSPEDRQALEKAREAFNKEREERVNRLTDERMSSNPENNPGVMTVHCVLYTLIIFSPVCILVVPVAYGVTSLVAGRRVSRTEPYMPAVPSEQELSAVHETILNNVTATGIASRLGDWTSDRDSSGAAQFPRLVITRSTVTFTAERNFVIKFLVQGQPSADVSWPQTEHSYEFGYYHKRHALLWELRRGETRLADSISTTYGLSRYGAPQTQPPKSSQRAAAEIAGVVEQEPRTRNEGCAPSDARVGNIYQRADGSRVAIVRIIGKSPACSRGVRPIAVEIEPR